MISDEIKELVRLAMASHDQCYHRDVRLCNTLTLIEVQLVSGEELTDEEYEQCQHYIADMVIESLILKGHVSAAGVDLESGEFLYELTEQGEEAYNQVVGGTETQDE